MCESFTRNFKSFWTVPVSPWPLGAFRIALGAIVVLDTIERLRDFHSFYVDGGLVPRGDFHLFGALWGPGTATRAALIFGATALVGVCFALGVYTRLSNALAWALHASIVERNLLVCDGSDMLVSVFLFWCLFVDMGAIASLDIRLGRREPRGVVPGWQVRLLQAQIVLVYIGAATAKLGGDWGAGIAMYRIMNNIDFTRPIGRALLGHSPWLCLAITVVTPALELALPLLLWAPRTSTLRRFGFLLGLSLHVGILVTMRVGWWSILMLASYLLFLLDEREASPSAVPAPATPKTVWAVLALSVACALVSFVALETKRSPPAPLDRLITTLQLRQDWGVFGPATAQLNTRWSATGRLTNGGVVDVLAVAAPDLAPNEHEMRSIRWEKLRATLVAKKARLLEVGPFLCRRYNSADGPKLDELTIDFDIEEVSLPMEGPGRRSRFRALVQPCRLRPAT